MLYACEPSGAKVCDAVTQAVKVEIVKINGIYLIKTFVVPL